MLAVNPFGFFLFLHTYFNIKVETASKRFNVPLAFVFAFAGLF